MEPFLILLRLAVVGGCELSESSSNSKTSRFSVKCKSLIWKHVKNRESLIWKCQQSRVVDLEKCQQSRVVDLEKCHHSQVVDLEKVKSASR